MSISEQPAGNVLVYIAFLAVPATWWVVYRTRFGLRLRYSPACSSPSPTPCRSACKVL